jgi:excinuclease ABC subunit B
MIQEMGYCSGIENYSRYLAGASGERPACLIDYFPEDFLVIIDESHVTLPQIDGMYNADRSRKLTLVEYGFRLPSSLDNGRCASTSSNASRRASSTSRRRPASTSCGSRPASSSSRSSAPPAHGSEDRRAAGQGQVDDLLQEVKTTVAAKQRVLVTTLTKRMARISPTTCRISASASATCTPTSRRSIGSRSCAICASASSTCWSGINLAARGLDLPEVALVAILDADKEGFLRSETTLIQTVGRAARNLDGASSCMPKRSPARCGARSTRRIAGAHPRGLQQEHGIVPRSIVKSVQDIMAQTLAADARGAEDEAPADPICDLGLADQPLDRVIARLEAEMLREARATLRERRQPARSHHRTARATAGVPRSDRMPGDGLQPEASIAALVEAALAEDLGAGDFTTECTVPAERAAVGDAVAKSPACSRDAPSPRTRSRLGRDCRVDGWRTALASRPASRRCASPVRRRAILGAERVALNFLQRLSGIATLTARYVAADRRHRCGHLRHAQDDAAVARAGKVRRALRRWHEPPGPARRDAARQGEPHRRRGRPRAALRQALGVRGAARLEVEIEVRTFAEFERRSRCDPTASCSIIGHRRGRRRRWQRRGRERAAAARGVRANLTLTTVRDYAMEGADILSVGALTHSAPALDLSLLVESTS